MLFKTAAAGGELLQDLFFAEGFLLRDLYSRESGNLFPPRAQSARRDRRIPLPRRGRPARRQIRNSSALHGQSSSFAVLASDVEHGLEIERDECAQIDHFNGKPFFGQIVRPLRLPSSTIMPQATTVASDPSRTTFAPGQRAANRPAPARAGQQNRRWR